MAVTSFPRGPGSAAQCGVPLHVLRAGYGHDAVHVFEVGLRAADDPEVAATARVAGRAVVTGNVADFAGERDVVLVFVRKKNLSAGGAPTKPLATLLDAWARANLRPYVGAHWPHLD